MVYVSYRTPVERFWVKVNKDGPPHPYDSALGPCWLWTKSTRHGGYGQFYAGLGIGRVAAHRFAYEVTHGPVAEGLVLRHSCDTALCVNPGHLIPGTQAENNADTRARGNPFGGKISRRGADHPCARVTAEQVAAIRARYTEGETGTALAQAFGLGTSQTYRIIRGQSWPTTTTKETQNA